MRQDAENNNLVNYTLKFHILVKGDLEESHGCRYLSPVSNYGRVKLNYNYASAMYYNPTTLTKKNLKPILNNMWGTNCTFLSLDKSFSFKTSLEKVWQMLGKLQIKGHEYQEGDLFLIIYEDQVGSNVDTGVARVGSEPAATTNDMIGLQEKTTNSKTFVFVVASRFWKAIY